MEGLENKTQAIGQKILNATKENRSWLQQIGDQMRWDDKLLDWAMGNPELRVQLFRLIDCLPALQSQPEIARHLQEYLVGEAVELPGVLKGLLNFAQPESLPGQVAATTMSKAVQTLAHKYIAGESVPQVLKTLERLRKDKMAFTIDLLGEAVITETEAKQYLNRYLELIEELSLAAKTWKKIGSIDEADGESLPQVQVSVKLTAFYSQFDALDAKGSQEIVSDRIRILLRRAQELGVAIHFDMEQSEYKDITLAILKDLLLEDEFRQRTNIGVTIQAYLRDSEKDLLDLIEWAKTRGYPLTVRLVKGAYWDRETIKAAQKDWSQPVFNDKAETDLNFEKLTEILLTNHQYIYAAIGSHNARSQAHAIAVAQSLQVPQRAFEMQVLYGMGDKLAKTLADMGYRVRVYCPYGELLPGMAYLIRRLLENTANSSFLRQNLTDKSAAELLSPPTPGATPCTPNYKSPFPNVADTDYSEIEARERSQQAFQKVRQQLGKTYFPLINGKYESTADIIDSVNPSNPTEIVGKVGLISIEQAEQAMQAAKAAFPRWKSTPASDRAAILRRAGELMSQRRDELCAWIVLEVGKPLVEADAEVSEAIDFCNYYASEMERLAEPNPLTPFPGREGGTIKPLSLQERGLGRGQYDVLGETNRYSYQPRGIAVVISPWNFPLAIAAGMTLAALVAGNCTLLKPAEVSTVIAAKFAEILVEAGVPTGVFQYVPGKGSTAGAYLVQHPETHLIAFTGSQEVGCWIYANAAILQPKQKHLKRVIAEMGGKNGIIVDESADLDQAVAGAVHSAFGYSGQKCSACSRIIVLDSVYDKFVTRFVEATRSLNIGMAELPGTQVGPVIDDKAQAKIKEYIAIGKQEAELALEMTAPETGYFVPPTVFKNVSSNARIAQEEIFGPVVGIIRAVNFEEALEIANGTNYALTGGLYSRTPSHIQEAQERFEVGNLYINRGITGAIVSRQPFGGFKLSGVGSKAGGPDYLLQFLEPKVVTENIQRHGFAPIEGVE